MATLKTQPNDRDVTEFLASIEDIQRREDCFKLLTLMQEITGETPQYWHSNIVGFGTYHYRYESGREGDWFITGFSPRKQNLTLYIIAGFDKYEELMNQLGRHKTGKSCLYVNRLADIDMKVLRELIARSVHFMREKHP
uniref:DUF1801 domain-containing protein n=1 Tax=Roseihalotalea indica TaxID=2867963 RepID=A0AA49JFS1_9BACT|nr:DUF1801 domain-containing protein [Tunicatimonas sp. TK19036]